VSDFPTHVPVAESTSGRVWEQQKPLLFRDLNQETRFPLVLGPLRARGGADLFHDAVDDGRKAPGRDRRGYSLLPSWTPTPTTANSTKEIRVRYGLTHEEMAQTIGASRETVTRLLSDLRKKQRIRLEGSTPVIRNRTALEALVS
jgi:CRP-like cAMP-binding protein